MDRSFLSQPPVVAAAKNFVCIRLTSYEDETEKAFVGKLVKGEIGNTAFAILSPDAKPVSPRGRGPGTVFKDAADMAKGIDAISAKYPAKKIDGIPALPVTLTPLLGLVVAASEKQPLVVVLAEDANRRDELEAKVATLAWSKTFEGRFTYATASSMKKELSNVKGVTITEGVVLIEPDTFGLAGDVVKEVPSNQIAQKLEDAMRETNQKHVRVMRTKAEHRALGYNEGIFYVPNLPVSGTGEANDRERYRLQLQQKKK
jgi:hypothetical protein